MSDQDTRAKAFADRMSGLRFGSPDADRAVAIVGVCGNAALREWTSRVRSAGPPPDPAEIGRVFDTISSMAEAMAHLADRLPTSGPLKSMRRWIDAGARGRIAAETRLAEHFLAASRQHLESLCDWSSSMRGHAQSALALIGAEVDTLFELSSTVSERSDIDPDVSAAAVAACRTRLTELAEAVQAIGLARQAAGEAHEAAACGVSAIDSADDAVASHLDAAQAGDPDAAALAYETLSDLPPPPAVELTAVAESAETADRLVRILGEAATNHQEQER